MDERILISLDRIEQCISALNTSSFTTAQVIREYMGHFCSDRQTPAAYSFNAQFGRLLSRNAERLGIVMIAPNESVQDDHGHPTTTAEWRVATAPGAEAGSSMQT